MDVGSTLNLSVMSGSIFIGSATISPENLSLVPLDTAGLTTYECFIFDGNDSAASGKLQVICRLEPHIELDDSDPDSDDDLMFEFDGRRSMLGLPKRIVPRISQVVVVAISLEGLVPLHRLVANSPFVVMSCNEWHATSEAQFLAGSSAKWINLPWHFLVRRLSVIRLLISSRENSFGKCSFSTRDLYDITPDENGFTMVGASIIDPTGAINGQLKLVLQINPLEYNAEQDEFDNFVVDGAEYDVTEELTVPVTLKIDRVFVEDLVSLHTLTKNCPVVSFKLGALMKSTHVILNAGNQAKWFDLDWQLVIHNKSQFISVSLKSGLVSGGCFELEICELLRIPRTSRGNVKIEGILSEGKRQCGNITLMARITKYSGLELPLESIEVSNSSNQIHATPHEELNSTEQIILGQFSILSVSATDMAQKIGFFKQNPQLFFSVGVMELSSEVCVWSSLLYFVFKQSFCRLLLLPEKMLCGKTCCGNRFLYFLCLC